MDVLNQPNIEADSSPLPHVFSSHSRHLCILTSSKNTSDRDRNSSLCRRAHIDIMTASPAQPEVAEGRVVTIDITSDPICPYSYISYKRLGR